MCLLESLVAFALGVLPYCCLLFIMGSVSVDLLVDDLSVVILSDVVVACLAVAVSVQFKNYSLFLLLLFSLVFVAGIATPVAPFL